MACLNLKQDNNEFVTSTPGTSTENLLNLKSLQGTQIFKLSIALENDLPWERLYEAAMVVIIMQANFTKSQYVYSCM